MGLTDLAGLDERQWVRYCTHDLYIKGVLWKL